MAMNIKSARTHDAIKELAERTGTSQAVAVDTAVHERLERLRRSPGEQRYELLWESLQALAPRARRALGTERSGDELYDERGVPK